MPRPRVVRVGKNGLVTMKNLSKAEADQVEKFLTTPAPDRREAVFNEDKYEWELVQNPFLDSDLSQVALGFISDESGNYAVELSYDPKTGMGKVMKRETLNKNINIARRDFELLIIKRFL